MKSYLLRRPGSLYQLRLGIVGQLIGLLFHPQGRQAKPRLQEVCPEHDRLAHRLPAVTYLGIHWLNQRQQLRQRSHLIHLLKRQLALALAAMLRQTRQRYKGPLKSRYRFMPLVYSQITGPARLCSGSLILIQRIA